MRLEVDHEQLSHFNAGRMHSLRALFRSLALITFVPPARSTRIRPPARISSDEKDESGGAKPHRVCAGAGATPPKAGDAAQGAKGRTPRMHATLYARQVRGPSQKPARSGRARNLADVGRRTHLQTMCHPFLARGGPPRRSSEVWSHIGVSACQSRAPGRSPCPSVRLLGRQRLKHACGRNS